MNRVVDKRSSNGKFAGYGWPATLELLFPPTGKPVDSRQEFTLTICPFCRCVHEIGGNCIPRHRQTSTPAMAVNRHSRGLFFQSQLFSNLNKTSFSWSNPIVGSTAIGNDNPLELNARTIQHLIAANLTLLQAWTWMDKLMRNESVNVTSFPLVVTNEIYTMGFDVMVLNVLPNLTVENSGNASLVA